MSNQSMENKRPEGLQVCLNTFNFVDPVGTLAGSFLLGANLYAARI